jgi:hypothetical protein
MIYPSRFVWLGGISLIVTIGLYRSLLSPPLLLLSSRRRLSYQIAAASRSPNLALHEGKQASNWPVEKPQAITEKTTTMEYTHQAQGVIKPSPRPICYP